MAKETFAVALDCAKTIFRFGLEIGCVADFANRANRSFCFGRSSCYA